MGLSDSIDMETCPVSDDHLERLLSATFNAVSEVSSQLSESQRAALAVYCYKRSHLRRLGLSLAALCNPQSLSMEAGYAGELIHAEAMRAGNAPDGSSDTLTKGGKAPVSLHLV
ncbi:hypothetical protein ABLO27_09230 [Roseibium sp. SCPC15]|uniref:hypothetical protein n=1 Tax=Roseibium sp. SCP15 TaxID=3141376 RepID=UPI0033369EA4